MAVNYSAGLLTCRAFFLQNPFLTHCWSRGKTPFLHLTGAGGFWFRVVGLHQSHRQSCEIEIALLDFLKASMKRPSASPGKSASKAAKQSDREKVEDKNAAKDATAGEVAGIFRSRFFLRLKLCFDLVSAFP